MSNTTRIIRRKEVRHLTGLSDSALSRAVHSGIFPPPVKLLPGPNARSVGWFEHEVHAWVESRQHAR